MLALGMERDSSLVLTLTTRMPAISLGTWLTEFPCVQNQLSERDLGPETWLQNLPLGQDLKSTA